MSFVLRAAAAAALASIASPLAAEPLTLEAAVGRALSVAPEAQVAGARLDALRASRVQAGVRPNATVELLAENVAGTGPYRFVDATEVTGSYAQTIERGGKRRARVALAEREIDLATAEAVLARLEVAARVQRAYVEATAANAAIAVAGDRLAAARSLAREVNRRVSAARDPLFAGTRAATRVAEAEVELELAEHAYKAALVRLTALWGGPSETVTLAAPDFLKLDRSDAQPDASPMAAIYAARSARAEAAVAVERTRAIQDPTVRGGLRHLRPADDVAFVVGVSIPLGNKTANRAAIDRAVAERRRVDAEAAVAEAQRRRDVTLAAERVHEARLEAIGIRDRVIPAAAKTLAQVRDGYARGGFTYLDVADAQRALGDARARLVASAREYHEAGAELDRLTGRFIPTIIEEAR